MTRSTPKNRQQDPSADNLPSGSSSPPPRSNQVGFASPETLDELGFSFRIREGIKEWSHPELVCRRCTDDGTPCFIRHPRVTRHGSFVLGGCDGCRKRRCSHSGKGTKRLWYYGDWADGIPGFRWIDVGGQVIRNPHASPRSISSARLPGPEVDLSHLRNALGYSAPPQLPPQRPCSLADLEDPSRRRMILPSMVDSVELGRADHRTAHHPAASTSSDGHEPDRDEYDIGLDDPFSLEVVAEDVGHSMAFDPKVDSESSAIPTSTPPESMAPSSFPPFWGPPFSDSLAIPNSLESLVAYHLSRAQSMRSQIIPPASQFSDLSAYETWRKQELIERRRALDLLISNAGA